MDDSNNQYGWMTYNQEQCLLQKVIISLPDDKMIKFYFSPCKSNTISSYYKCIRFIFHSQRDMMIPTTMLRDDDIYDLPAIMPKDDET